MRVFIRRFYILGIVFVLVGGLNTFIGYRHLESQLSTEIEESISSRLNFIIGEISSDLLNVERALNAADIAIRLELEPDHIVRFFDDLLLNDDSFLAMFLGKSPTEVIYVNRFFAWDNPVDPTTRPWYQETVQSGELVFTGPYVDAAQGSLVLTMAKPIYDEKGTLLGVVGIDKSLEGMIETLKLGKPSEHGYSLAFNQSGERLFEDQTNSFPEVVLAQVMAEPSGIISANVDGDDGYLRWQQVGNTGLTLATFAPISDFLDAKGLAIRVISSSVLTLALLWLLVYYFQRKFIIKPMEELDQDIAAIAIDEDITYRLPQQVQDPFGDLRKAINSSLAKAQEHFEHIVYQQEELTAAYTQLMAHEEQLQSQYNEIKEQETHIRFLAEHDALTGLFNREKFEQDLLQSLEANQVGSVVFLDIDNFKNINDTQGHVYGDGVLNYLARTLEKAVGNNASVYRFGGDEFLLLLKDKVNTESIKEMFEDVSRRLNDTDSFDARRKQLTISAGVVCYPQNGRSVDELLSKADLALHDAKQGGKNRVRFFEGSMAETFAQRIQVESLLRNAVESNGFKLVYQPIVETSTGEIAYFEALLRLEGQNISPGVFISIAEETDLIHPVGRWVIRAAVSQLAQWKKAGHAVKPIAINLSPKQFYDDGLVEFLAEQFVQMDVDPGLIEMEITETALIDNPHQAIKIIERIKALGIKMALDDFGTGYLAINHITNIPVDRIKLDRSMTQGLLVNIQVIEGLIQIAHGLNMEVVAEGVETLDAAQMLAKVSCDYLQGYLFSRPIYARQVELMLDQDYKVLLKGGGV